jgi:putative transposase
MMPDTRAWKWYKKWGADQFNSPAQTQRFLTLYGLTQNLFRLGRHLLQAVNYRILRTRAFQVWQDVVCA